MTMQEIPWLAGYLEGEGSFYKNDNAASRNYGSRTIRAQTTDEDIAMRLREIVAGSCLNGPYDKGHKLVWEWSLNRRSLVQALAASLAPHMGERRRQQIATMLAGES